MDNQTVVKLLVGASITGLVACTVPTGPSAKDAPEGSQSVSSVDDPEREGFAALCCW